MSDTPTPRHVPGAPPSVPTSKSSKRKRKTGKGTRSDDSPALSSVAIPDSTSTAAVEKSQDSYDIKDGPVADSLLEDTHSTNGIPSSEHALDQAKHSPIVDLIQKRIKATSKKIVRISLVDHMHTSMALPLTRSNPTESNTKLRSARRRKTE
jgi:hypothetical protein